MSELRTKLLALEPLGEDRQHQLQQELQAMFEPPLGRWEKVYWGLSVLGSTTFAVSALAVVLLAPIEPRMRAMWGLLGVFNALAAAFILYGLRRGRIDLRHQFALGKALVGVTLLVTVLILINAIARPSLENLAWGLVGVTFFVLTAAIAITNQVVEVALSAREQSLRLELRLAEVSEKMAAR